MGTIRSAWDDEFPPAMVRLMRILARSRRAKLWQKWRGSQARKSIARAFERVRWKVSINKPKKRPDGGYERPKLASLVATKGAMAISVEFGSTKPSKGVVERLAASPGVKVLVLTNSSVYEPWKDRRSPWHKVSPEEIEKIDYVIGARAREVKPQLASELARGYVLHDFDPVPVLRIIDEHWQREYPVSCHGNVVEAMGPRHLPQILTAELDMHPLAAYKAVREIKEKGLAKVSKNRRNELRGLKLTDAGQELLAGKLEPPKTKNKEKRND